MYFTHVLLEFLTYKTKFASYCNTRQTSAPCRVPPCQIEDPILPFS